jgi:hypothetical protein
MTDDRLCFVIMPFQPELHYFYLYLRDYIQAQHGLICKRADDSANYPNQEAFMETILQDIQKATVVIADCTGANPNVLYELGIAHARNKKTILITQDDPDNAPADIRHRTFIRYRLKDDVSFFAALDNRLQDAFFEDYRPVYAKAVTLFGIFREDSGLSIQPVDLREFITRSSGMLLPEPADNYLFASKTLLLLMAEQDRLDIQIVNRLYEWTTTRYD